MLVYYFMHKQKRSKLFASHKNWVREGGWLNLSKLNYFITPFFLSGTNKENMFLELLYKEQNI